MELNWLKTAVKKQFYRSGKWTKISVIMMWKLKGTIETRKRNNQSKNKFPNYKKYRFIQKHTKKFGISCWIRNENRDLLSHTVQWENAVDRSSGWRKSGLHEIKEDNFCFCSFKMTKNKTRELPTHHFPPWEYKKKYLSARAQIKYIPGAGCSKVG